MSSSFYYRQEDLNDLRLVPRDRITRAVQWLIMVNVAVFAFQLMLDVPFGRSPGAGYLADPPGGILVNYLAFQPSAFFIYLGIWKPLTYMFLHGGLMHLFFNLLWLYFFGPEVERTLGTRQFLLFYALCGAVAVLATGLPVLVGAPEASVTGASGAAMAVMVAFAVIDPQRQFYLFPLPVPINAVALVIIVIAMNVLSAFQPGSNTSVVTHIGGMAAGYGYMTVVPFFRRRRQGHWRAQREKKSSDGPLGEAVDNIFRFEDKKRPPW